MHLICLYRAIVTISYESAGDSKDLDEEAHYIVDMLYENSQLLEGTFKVNIVRSGKSHASKY